MKFLRYNIQMFTILSCIIINFSISTTFCNPIQQGPQLNIIVIPVNPMHVTTTPHAMANNINVEDNYTAPKFSCYRCVAGCALGLIIWLAIDEKNIKTEPHNNNIPTQSPTLTNSYAPSISTMTPSLRGFADMPKKPMDLPWKNGKPINHKQKTE